MARSIAISGHFHIWLISTVHKIVPQDLVDIRLNRKSTKPHSVHAHMNELKRVIQGKKKKKKRERKQKNKRVYCLN